MTAICVYISVHDMLCVCLYLYICFILCATMMCLYDWYDEADTEGVFRQSSAFFLYLVYKDIFRCDYQTLFLNDVILGVLTNTLSIHWLLCIDWTSS